MDARLATRHEAEAQQEKQAHAVTGQNIAAPAGSARGRERPAEKHEPDGAHAPSQCRPWDRQQAGGRGGLYFSAEETSLGSVDNDRKPIPTAAFSCGCDLKL